MGLFRMLNYDNIRRSITRVLAVPALALALYGCKPAVPTPAPDAKVSVSGLEGRLNDNKVDMHDDHVLGNVNIYVENGSIDSITWEQGSATGTASYNASANNLTFSGTPGYGMIKVKVYGINDDAVKTSPTTIDGVLLGPNGSSDFYTDGAQFDADFGMSGFSAMDSITEGKHDYVGVDRDITSSDIETMLASLPFKDYAKGCIELTYGKNDKTLKYIVFTKTGSSAFNYAVFGIDKETCDSIYAADPSAGGLPGL